MQCSVWIVLSTECRLNTPPVRVSCCYWQPEMESSPCIDPPPSTLFMFGIYAHSHAHSRALHGCLDHTHLSFQSPANVLVVLPECTSAESTSCSLLAVRSAQVLSGCFTLRTRLLFFPSANGGKRGAAKFISRRRARRWLVMGFFHTRVTAQCFVLSISGRVNKCKKPKNPFTPFTCLFSPFFGRLLWLTPKK